MKSRLEKVYSKLPKTELATQKIELGIIDDIKQSVKDIKAISDKMKSNANKVENIFSKVNSDNKKLKQKAEGIKKDAVKKYFQAEKAFKELGIDMPSDLEKLVNDLYDTEISRYVSNNKNIFSF